MGQKQLLLLILSAIIVGVGLVLGINMFAENSAQAANDRVTQDALTIAHRAQSWYKRNIISHNGRPSFEGIFLSDLNFPSKNENGTYNLEVCDANEIKITGKGKDGFSLEVIVYGDSALEVVSENTKTLNQTILIDNKNADQNPNLQYIDKIIAKLRMGNIAFNSPDSMQVNENWPVVLLASLGISRDSLATQIPKFITTKKIGHVEKDSIRVSTKMEAHLSGDNFIIKPITPISQYVLERDATRWEWSIKATETGYSTLYLTLNAFIVCDAETTTQTIQTYRKNILVYVRPSTALLSWINKNSTWLSWAVSFFGIVLTGIITYRVTVSLERRTNYASTKKLQIKKAK